MNSLSLSVSKSKSACLLSLCSMLYFIALVFEFISKTYKTKASQHAQDCSSVQTKNLIIEI